MFDWLKKKPEVKTEPKSEPKTKKKSAKELANEAGEPYISVVSIELDSDDVGNGAFELDWNDLFVAKLVKAGYMQKKDDTDAEMVDRWFQNVCRHVVMETWEQEQAMTNPSRFIKERDIGDGRSEVS